MVRWILFFSISFLRNENSTCVSCFEYLYLAGGEKYLDYKVQYSDFKCEFDNIFNFFFNTGLSSIRYVFNPINFIKCIRYLISNPIVVYTVYISTS